MDESSNDFHKQTPKLLLIYSFSFYPAANVPFLQCYLRAVPSLNIISDIYVLY